MDESQTWYLMKHEDGTVFGPVPFEELSDWAQRAQISPLDKVSTDQASWVKAPMIPELHMDWLIEVSPDQFYGPTTIMAVREFLIAREINENTRLTNCAEETHTTVGQIPELRVGKKTEEAEPDEGIPVRTSIRANLQQRIRELEEALMEERRARETAEAMLGKLETQMRSR